jgi:hypothetical protein
VQTRVAGDPTTQVHDVQTRVTGLAVHSTPAVTVMSAPHAANAPVLTPENGPHVADVQRAEQLPSQLLLNTVQIDVQLRQLLGVLQCLELPLLERVWLRALLVQLLLNKVQMNV